MRDKTITIFDTTLRDGEQTPGVSLTSAQKLEIAYQLDKLGVDIIEAGFPISSEGDKESVKSISNAGLDAEVCGLARVLKKDIDACFDSDVGLVHTFVPTSEVQRKYTIKKSQEEVIQMAVEAVQYIKDNGRKCMFSAMDATRTEPEYLIEVFKAVQEAGCDIINVPDTVGVMVPSAMYRQIKDIAAEIRIPIDVHCHNDFGLAVANSLMAVEAGASQVQVTVNGIGERAGNADLSQTVMSLIAIYGAKTNIRTEYLVETSKLVENYTGVRLPPNTPVVGQNAFSHESGIHSQGVLEKSDTFEPGIMTPEMVGHKRRIVLGKHTGKHAVKQSLESAGIITNDKQLDEIVSRIKEIANKGKQITDADLNAVASAVLGKASSEEELIKLKEVSVMTGNILTPTAVVKADIEGKEIISAKTGVGPVDAALNAVRDILGENNHFKLQEFRIDAITGGADALADVYIGLENEKGRIVTARSANPDIVMASVEALVNAMNLLYKKEKKAKTIG
ncbi:MAG: 2-isopropylmalate synthase [Methanosarcina thermophila]|nr:2-isopropylmalate synthase [Methanosarcina thermophila]NLU56711.1 2-isopropylmalate synthase [Methanosarcina thermophila]HOA69541.1 2-isopropylmalate synthase [Methanosarcina thermophila]HOQ66570.1 2-isopropylmalate synthase [Methanosarcina thermophila]HPT80651.1 2-isopropylmalate synthase [Methanosarcina thermophila]HPZ20696.1 2-isopropylmalate synthase [Methanosarcina thermophila]